MKLTRYGESGEERPGLLDDTGWLGIEKPGIQTHSAVAWSD